MNKRVVFHALLGTAIMTALLLAVGLLLRPVLAAPRVQEGVPELTIVKTADGDGTIAPGDTVCFTISITNTRTITATNVTVRDDFDEKALPTITDLSDTQVEGGSPESGRDVITWQLGDLAPKEVRLVRYKATAAESFEPGTTKVCNYASVSFNDGKIVQAEPVVLEVRAPQLTLSRKWEQVDSEGEVAPGATVRYIIHYSNEGTADATNVVLVDSFKEDIVQKVDQINPAGQRDAATVRWNLGNVAAKDTGEVSYEVTLKPVLALGTIEVRNEATISADDVESVPASDFFVLRTPLLIIERQREDLNGRPIQPGDTLRFTIRVRNRGAVEAEGVIVRDDYDEAVVAEVSNISAGGNEEPEGENKEIKWELKESLGPDAEQTVSYEVSLKSEIAESTEAVNRAIIQIDDVEVARAQTTMTIEPAEPVPEEAAPVKKEVISGEVTIIILVSVSMGAGLLAINGLVLLILWKGVWKERYFRLVLEGITIVVIAAAVLGLAINGTIESDGAVSILSGIAGYVLGRTVSEGGDPGQGEG